ncbi:MAG: hypothetical protein CVT92_05210 [Bacteroidetes bacterium HGW-Bacteroidetes-1]|jgi:methyl-accepting chemotaxis protein|nr:MAG: hypothetical protein CVT92_05210 [Bacteroidetes bacterium HGW-Bacteroidetes-1]
MNALILKISSRVKIIFGFTLIFISLIIMLLVAISGINQIKDIQNELNVSFQITKELAEFRADENRMHGLLLELTFFTNENERKGHLKDIEELKYFVIERENNIHKLLTKHAESLALFEAIGATLDQYRDNREKQLEFIQDGKSEEANRFSNSVLNPLYDKIIIQLSQVEEMEDKKVEQLKQQSDDVLKVSATKLISLGILMVLVSTIIIIGIMRMLFKIGRRLRDGVTVLGTSSAEIQTTVAEISTGTNETAAAISETTTTVEEIRQTSMMANQKAKSLMISSQKAAEIAENGLESSQQMIDAMKKIENQMDVISATIAKLSDQNRSIGEITSTVSDIADQSNLLAVNAAIEAAKAGEHGRGFTVVAQEIRSLAEQSKKSTAQVKEILNEIQKSVQHAVEVIKQGSSTVDEGSKLVLADRQVVELLTETVEEAVQASIQISSSSQQQMAGMDQIVPAMENIKQASEQNVAGIRQAHDAARDLNELGQSLKRVMDRYNL